MDKILQVLYDKLIQPIFPNIGVGVQPYAKAGLFLLIALLLGMIIRQVVLGRLNRLAQQTENFYDDIILDTLRRKTILWVILIAFVLTIPTLSWEPNYQKLAEQIAMAVLVLSMTMAVVRAVSEAIKRHSDSSAAGVGNTTLIKSVVAFIFYMLGLAVILSLFDISLLPAITALGIGGLAVALAFQDTLANLFAGIYMTLSKQIHVEDYIQLSGGEEGFVQDISWRTTTLRTLANNLVIIPNKKLSESILTNYHLPNSQLSVELAVGVSYDADPAWVEEVLIDEVAKAHGEVNGLLEAVPVVRFTTFSDSSLTIKAYPKVDKVEHQFAVRHELMKRVYKRFKAEGIEIPFPIRTLQFSSKNGGSEFIEQVCKSDNDEKGKT
ncbi:MAG: mechanosensitive ion channel family protein [Chlorobi bacterium]|nr:mechanosensitive ion channel family protein [Chlorobiota bacterium]